MMFSQANWERFNQSGRESARPHLFRALVLTLAVFLCLLWAPIIWSHADHTRSSAYGFLMVGLVISAALSFGSAISHLSEGSYLGVNESTGEAYTFSTSPKNSGQEVILVRPVVTVHRHGSFCIKPIWLKVQKRRGHQSVQLFGADTVRHHLKGWAAWTDDPRKRIHFIDSQGRSRTATNDKELAKILSIIESGSTFESADCEQQREQELKRIEERRAYAQTLRDEQQRSEDLRAALTDLAARLAAFCEYFPEEGPPRGAPIREARRVIEELDLRESCVQFASRPQVEVCLAMVKLLEGLKFARWSRPTKPEASPSVDG